MFLLTAPIAIKQSYFGWNLLCLSIKHPGPNLSLSIPNLDLSEKIGKVVNKEDKI